MFDTLKDLVVLYVEDQKDAQEELVNIFNKTFKKTIYASDGEDGLNKFIAHKKRDYNVDIVVTDINMPRLNGLKMIREIKKLDNSVKYVLTTAYTDTEYLLESIELGITAYITKPINVMKLLEKIEYAYKEKVDKSIIKDISEKMKTHNVNDVNEFLELIDENITTEDDIVELIDDFSYSYKNKVLMSDNNKHISLVNQEIMLLEYLLTNPQKVFSYEELLDAISINDNTTSINNLRTVIKSIRKKSSKNLIKNLSGIGYRVELSQKR